MTDISEALVAWLLSDSGISQAIGARIAPGFAPPDDPRPYLTYFQVDRPREKYLGGQDHPHPRFQLNVWDRKKATVEVLSKKIRDRIDALGDAIRATTGGYNLHGFSIEAVWVEDERDTPQDPGDGSSRTDYGKQIDVVIWFTEG